jgi:hypothetical protein
MLNFLLFVAACCCLWAWVDRRRARANRARAIRMLEDADLSERVERAVAALETSERWRLEHAPTGDPERLAIVHEILDAMEAHGEITAGEIEVALKAMDIAAGRG